MSAANGNKPLTTGEAGRWMRVATVASVTVALTLIAAKTLAWWWSGSASLLGSLADSAMDALASGVNLMAVMYAIKPADSDHKFGHGKAEALAALAQGLLISTSSLLLIVYSVRRLYLGETLNLDGGIWVIGVSTLAIVLSLGLVALQKNVVRKTGSQAIEADSLHYLSDLLLNVSVIVAIAISYLGFDQADNWAAIGIGFYLLNMARKLVKSAFDVLMDREMPDAFRRQIFDLAHSVDGVSGVHDLRTRRSGTQVFIQLHIDLDGGQSLKRAHSLCDTVSERIREEVPRSQVLIHADPVDSKPSLATAGRG
ncbi:MAG: cation diffusion facilitator family transporter [Pseudomonadota bacterium]